MAEPTTSVQPDSPDAGLPKKPAVAAGFDLHEKLAERDEEILRLRDLLIGRDAELGAARGRLAMLEQDSRRLTSLGARIPIPGAARLINLLARLLQGRRG
jgi:hypothetical protein